MSFPHPNYPQEKKLSSAQVRALKAIQKPKSDPEFWGVRGRSGGARNRMLKGLADLGFIDGPPWKLTSDGREVLKARIYRVTQIGG